MYRKRCSRPTAIFLISTAIALSLGGCPPPPPPPPIGGVDPDPPTISKCPAAVTIASNSNCKGKVPDLRSQLEARDDVSPPVTITQEPPPGTEVDAGVMLISVTATDAAGNHDSCAVELTIVSGAKLIVDKEPADATVIAGTDCMGTVPDFTSQFVVRDTCNSNLIATQSPPAGAKVPLGPNAVTVTVTNGIDSEMSTVTLTVMDDDAPRIRACLPEPYTLTAGAGCSAALPDLTDQIIADDCGGIVSITQSPPPGTILTGPEGTEVTFTVTDNEGNVATCAARVVPEDTTAPNITACVANRTLPGDGNGTATMPAVTGEVGATDNCDTSLAITQSPGVGATLSLGDNEVTITVKDDAGNTAACTANFTVVVVGGGEGFTEAVILHRGSEALVAGPDVDSAVGLQTPAGYGIGRFGNRSIALSGDGQKIWFVLFDEFPNVEGGPQTQLWSVNIDGTGGARSALPSDDFGNGMHLATNLNGNMVVAENPREADVFKAEPGSPASLLFNFANVFPGSCISGSMRVSDDGTGMIYSSFCDTRIYQANLAAALVTPTLVTSAGSFQFMGISATQFNGQIDANSDLSRWIVSTQNFSFSENRNRFPVFVGNGLSNPSIELQSAPNDFDVTKGHNITDDGQTIAYSVGPASIGETNSAYVHPVNSTDWIEIMDDVQSIGGMALSDDGSIAYLSTNVSFGHGYSFLYDLTSGTRRTPGSQRFTDGASVRFGLVRFSDDGSVLASPVGRGVYVLHNGVDGLPGFPSIDRILYRYDEGECTLTVRVEVDAPDGVERIFTLPLYQGMEPTRTLAEEDNPFFNERDGGGVNVSTIFEEVDTGVWERVISLANGGNCKEALVDADFNLRIVLIAANGDQGVFQDFAPLR